MVDLKKLARLKEEAELEKEAINNGGILASSNFHKQENKDKALLYDKQSDNIKKNLKKNPGLPGLSRRIFNHSDRYKAEAGKAAYSAENPIKGMIPFVGRGGAGEKALAKLKKKSK
jgi:hypothetical protein